MKKLSLTAICLAISALAACGQGMTGAARLPANQAAPVATQPPPESGLDRDSGGGGY